MFRGKSPKRPRTPELALQEIVAKSEAWVRRYEEAWFDVPVTVMGEKVPVLDDTHSVAGQACQAWLPEAMRATLQLAETAMKAHETLTEWAEELKAREAKRQPAKKTSRRKR